MAAPTRTGSNRSNKSDSAPTVNIKQKLVLSGEQQKVLQLVVSEGKNMFFTGSAGASRSIGSGELASCQSGQSLPFQSQAPFPY
jgi:hypothetical protein